MFLVVFLPRVGGFTVIPENWLHDSKNQAEKFLNYGINSNQLHVCFYTDNLNARDEYGIILQNFEPNFAASFGNIFPAEGCYLCQVIKAKGISPIVMSLSILIQMPYRILFDNRIYTAFDI